MDRIAHPGLRAKEMSAEDAAALIRPGHNVGMSGFTGAAYPKAVPVALAKQIGAAHAAGQDFRIGVWTGASTAPELDGELALVDGVDLRMPYQSDPETRKRINEGSMNYCDIHLSHVAPTVWQGFFGRLDTAVVEVAGIDEHGDLIPASSVGNNKTWLDIADQVILEVNEWHSLELLGMHDIYYGTELPPNRVPIPMTHPADRIGQTTLRVDPEKVVAVVRTNAPDRNSTLKPVDDISKQIAGHFLEFLEHQVKVGRIPKNLLPLQSGVGNIANAVLAGLDSGPFRNIYAYTEVIQDGMVDLLDSGTVAKASATAFSLSPPAAERMNERAAEYREKIILRPQEISNHPEVIRRLGVIACNGMVEADIYGNVNSTHVMGTRIMNGIGGSGDFARNSLISCFVSPSTAKGGDISVIVPMASHVDHTEHDVSAIATEWGLADLRGLSPKKRAKKIIDTCAHPDFRPALHEYFEWAQKVSKAQHTPHDLSKALGWHQRFLDEGTMRP